MATNPEVIPKELRYGSVPTMPQSRSYLFKQRSEYVEYPAVSQGSTIEINIPRLQRTYLTKDSYLKLNVGLNFDYTTKVVDIQITPGSTVPAGDTTFGVNPATPITTDITGWDAFCYTTTACTTITGLIQSQTKVEYYDAVNNIITLTAPVVATTVPSALSAISDAMCIRFVQPDQTSIYLDRSGIYGMIDRIEIYDYMGSTLLERTSGISDLMSLLMDTHSSWVESSNHYQISSGTGTAIADNIISDERKGFEVQNPPMGDLFAQMISTAFPDALQTKQLFINRQFAIPLPSFLGLFSDKYVPLHNGFTVKIILNDPNYALMVNSSSNLKPVNLKTVNIANVEFCAQVLELGPQAEGLVMDSLGGQPVALHTKSFRLFKDVINGASTTNPQSTFRLDMDLNVISLTNLLWFMKPLEYKPADGTSTVIPAADLYYQNIGQRIRNYLMKWNFQYGSSYLPNVNGIQCMTNLKPSIDSGYAGPTEDPISKNDLDSYMELIKSRHRLNSSDLGTLISYGEYFKDNYETKILSSSPYEDEVFGSACPKFACGLDLELVSGKSREVICGMNTNGLNTCINGWFNLDNMSTTSKSSVCSALLLCWAEYDAFVNILPGVASTVAF